ncbi:hypothetical protein ONZ45_g17705 [Pleurotus djamor]|nr:hypothetical protein ONZ45_g17705 [Pleurotus djamor]
MIPRLSFPTSDKPVEIDPESLLPGVIRDLKGLVDAWSIGSSSARADSPIDVLELLKSTTQAVRSIRNYVLSLPDESAGTIRAQFRARTLGPGRIRSLPKSSSSQPDPLTLIRRSALEVLSVLRELEERSRVPLTDDAYDAQSDGGGGSSRVASPVNVTDDPPIDEEEHPHVGDSSVTFSLVQVHGRYESVPVWEDEDDHRVWSDEEEEKKEGWDERLVVGGGWLYKQDITLSNLAKERSVISSYVDVVDEVLFEGKKEGSEERGWERRARKKLRSRSKGRRVSAGDGETRSGSLLSGDIGGGRRRVSTGMVDAMGGLSLVEEDDSLEGITESPEPESTPFSQEELDDEDLPPWARRDTFAGDTLGRVHALLSASLPTDLLRLLAPSSNRLEFLDSLASGQLLCVAYNTRVRKSKHGWGYIHKDSIHDIVALEQASSDVEGVKTGWTFRRIDNLILWVGALKLRYLLPIHIPPGQPKFPPTVIGTPMTFSARQVARKEDGWDTMLETVLLRWADRVVEERRKTTASWPLSS